jgi:hypothetical protein
MNNAVTVTTPESKASHFAHLAENYLSEIELFEVTDATVDDASEKLAQVSKAIKDTEADRKSLTAPLDLTKKRLMDKYRPIIEMLNRARLILRQKGEEYHAEKDRIREEALAKQREENEKERKRLEGLRLAAEKREREAREKAEAAENEKERRRLLAKAEKDREKAAAFEEKAETAPAAVAPAPTKVKGMTRVTRWRAEILNPRLILIAVTEGRLPAAVVTINQSELNKIATAMKDAGRIDGCKIVPVKSVSSR